MKAQKNPLTLHLKPLTLISERSNKMKQNLLLLAVVLLVALGFSSPALADQDPNDNGVADTLYMECYPGDEELYPPGPFFVRVPLYVTNDIPNPNIDSIAGFIIPLCYTHTNPAKYCSLSAYWNDTHLYPFPDFDRSIFRHFIEGEDTLIHNWMMDLSQEGMGEEWNCITLDVDGTSHFWLSLIACGFQDQRWPGGSRRLLATMTFKLEDTMTVCVDTCFWPPTSRLAFGRSDAVTYIPQIWDDYLGQEEYCFSTSIAPPQIAVSPDSFYIKDRPDDQIYEYFEVSNVGGGFLEYDITYSGSSWLSVSPDSGSVPGGETDTVTLTINTTGLDGHYYDTLRVISNSGEKQDQDTVLVPVHLFVTGQDPNDNGVADTLYMECYPGDEELYPPGPFFVRVPLYVTNDIPNPNIDSIAGFIIPLCYTHTNPAKYCSLSAYWNDTHLYPFPDFDRSIFRHFIEGEDTLIHNWMMDLSQEGMGEEWNCITLDVDGTSHFWLSLIACGFQDQRWPGGSRRLLATMTFKLEDTMTVCVDTCFWPPTSRLAFGRSDAVTYIPQIWDDYLGQEEYCFSTSIVEHPVFIAHFMTPEGEPYPFDVIISDGEWVQEFDSVTYIETQVPPTATYTMEYERAGLDFRFQSTITLTDQEVACCSVYAIDFTQKPEARTTPFVILREVGANDSLSWTWDADSLQLSYTVWGEPGKRVAVGVIIDKEDEAPPHYILTSYTPTRAQAPLLEIDGVTYPRVYNHGWGELVELDEGAKHTTVLQFSKVDTAMGIIEIEDALYNYAFLDTFTTTVQSIDGVPCEPANEYHLYVVPPGSYIIGIHNLPELYHYEEHIPHTKDRPDDQMYIDVYPPKIAELAPFTFDVAAENFFAHSSYSNLYHAPGDSLTVDISTEMECDWWGYFVLPTDLTVGGLFAYSDAKGEEELSEFYDFTITHIEDSDLFLVVVRIEPYYNRLKLEFATRGDITGDGVIDIGDIVYVINYLFKGGVAPQPKDRADVNCDGVIDLGDVVYLINYLFKGGPPPCQG